MPGAGGGWSLSTWRSITVTFIHSVPYEQNFITYYIDNNLVFMGSGVAALPAFASSDRIIIGGPGGFIGEMANFRVWTPGTQVLYTRKFFL